LKPAIQVGVRESKSSFLLYAFTVPFKGLGTVQLKKKKKWILLFSKDTLNWSKVTVKQTFTLFYI